MNRRFSYLLGILMLSGLLLNHSPKAYGQLSGSNLAEFQYGNIPGEKPANLSALYDQLNLSFRQKNIFLKTKIESFQPSFSKNRSYTKISQFSAQYSDKGFKIQLGSLYQTIGRGLLLRNYEQPSSIWEGRGYRVKYGFFKDLQGLAASYTKDNFQIKLLRGRVLAVDLPPTLDNLERRPDLIEGGEGNYTVKGQTIGLAFMRHTNDERTDSYATAYVDGYLKSISYYAEYAFGGNNARAAYGGINFFSGSFGISLEYKNYNNFLIGAGINDPPTLIKEHSSRLLNRSTHVPILTNESGYQTEVSYQFKNSSIISFNHSGASNKIGEDLSFTFREYYIDYEIHAGQNWYGKIFADFSQDPFNAENQRYTGGIILEREIHSVTAGLDLEMQKVNRDFGEIQEFSNYYTSLNISKGSKMGISLVLELSNDPFLIEEGKEFIAYPGVILSYQPVHSTSLSLFAGKRRGGPACNSGVCYDVLDFEGIELRITTNFNN